MRIDVVSIFPEYLAPLDLSLIGRARRSGLLDLHLHDLRHWTDDRHHTVDDTPAGGGAGMVMRPDVWGRALEGLMGSGGDPGERPVLVIPTPSGESFTQRVAEDLSSEEQIVFACGRYEGIDARVAESYQAGGARVREVSIGDYVLNGGEAAALVIIEAVARLVPGVLGNPDSVVEESHSEAGLLEYPVYTRPVEWQGRQVPDVLLSGDHARVERWRRDQALVRTARRRPDMIAALEASGVLTDRDREVLTLVAAGSA